jgi:hypothetical protein
MISLVNVGRYYNPTFYVVRILYMMGARPAEAQQRLQGRFGRGYYLSDKSPQRRIRITHGHGS